MGRRTLVFVPRLTGISGYMQVRDQAKIKLRNERLAKLQDDRRRQEEMDKARVTLAGLAECSLGQAYDLAYQQAVRRMTARVDLTKAGLASLGMTGIEVQRRREALAAYAATITGSPPASPAAR